MYNSIIMLCKRIPAESFILYRLGSSLLTLSLFFSPLFYFSLRVRKPFAPSPYNNDGNNGVNYGIICTCIYFFSVIIVIFLFPWKSKKDRSNGRRPHTPTRFVDVTTSARYNGPPAAVIATKVSAETQQCISSRCE